MRYIKKIVFVLIFSLLLSTINGINYTNAITENPITNQPISSNIIVTNNKAGMDDVVELINLDGGDLITVYNSATGGTLLGSSIVQSGQTSARIIITQLGISAGSVYITLKKDDMLESKRTAASYTAETLIAPTSTNIKVTNNKTGLDDTVEVMNLIEGTSVNIYNASSGGVLLGSSTLVSGQTSVVVTIPQIGVNAGNIYVSISMPGKNESTRTAQSYTAETTSPPAASYITVVNNYIGTDDVITVTGLSEGDEIKVYTASTEGMLLTSGVVEAGQTSVVLNVPQLGSISGTIYVSLTKVNKLESTRTQKSYATEPTTIAPTAASITVTNNKAGIDDTVKITNLVEGDIVTVYSASTGGTVLGSATVEAGQTSAVIVNPQLGTGAGSVYVTIKKDGKLESTRTAKAYDSETTSPPAASYITVVNNYIGTDDIITVTGLSEGDEIKVYNASTAGTMLTSGVVAAGQTSVVLNVTQLGSIAGTIYVSLTKVNKLESTRTQKSYVAEPTTTAPTTANITVTNNKAGIDDTVKITNLVERDIVTVYSASTGGTVLGSATVEAGHTSAVIVNPQLGTGAGSVYVTIKKEGKLESTRTAKAYDSETSTAPSNSYIKVVNNYIGTDDVITVSGLSEGDEIKVYDASTAGTLLTSGVVEPEQTSVVLIVPQLGSTSGIIYVSVTKVNKLESARTQMNYTAEPTTTAPVASSITVTNNKAGMDDIVKITNLVEGDTVTVYSASTGGTVLGSTTIEAGQTSAVIVIPQIGTGTGSVYVTIKKDGKLESTRTAQSYTSETSTAPSTSYITVVNNYIGTDDIITVTGLSEGDEIKVYNASTAGTLLVSGVVEAGQTSVVLNVPQLGSTSGTIYVSVTKVNKLESTRTQKSYAAEPTTTAPVAASITVTNNKAGMDDTVKITNLVEGDTVTVYSALTGGTVLGSVTVEAGQTLAVIVIPQIGTGAGSVYVTIKKDGKLESTRTAQSYTSETSTAPSTSYIKVVNNYIGTDDVITVTGLVEGDEIKVYNASTAGTLLISGIVEAGQISVVLNVPQLGSTSGIIYVSVTKVNKLESTRTQTNYAAEPTTTAPVKSNITVTNNKAGIDDTVKITNLIEGDIVTVYSASTGGTVLGCTIVEAGQTSAIVVIPQIGTGTGYVYVTIKNEGKLESARTAQSYTSEASVSPVAANITIVNNYIGTDDIITVTGLSEGDEIKVYNASTDGTLLVSGVVEAGQTSVVLNVPQLGSAAGTIYVSLTNVNKQESTRISKNYDVEPTTEALLAENISITNNKVGIDDKVKITNLAEGDIVTVYSASTGGTVLGSSTVEAGQTSAVVVIPQISTGTGYVYVTIKKEGKLESARTMKDYPSELSVFPSTAIITVNNTYSGIDDTITVSGLLEGDEIKVYNSSTAGKLLASGKVQAGQNSLIMSVPQLGSTAGTIHLTITTVTNLESARVSKTYSAEPTPTEPIANAISAVIKAETSKLQSDSDGARALVNDLSDSSTKTTLAGRLDALQIIIDVINAVPTNLRASYVGITNISLVWDAPSYKVAGYKIYRNGQETGTTLGTEYTDINLSQATFYNYFVRAYDAVGNLSNKSGDMTIKTDRVAESPNNLKAINFGSYIILSWDSVEDAIGYQLYINGHVENVTSTEFSHMNVQAGQEYKYKIRTVYTNKNSDWSSEISKVYIEQLEINPPILTANTMTNKITISWNTFPHVTGYEIEADGNIIEFGSDIMNYTHSNLLSNSSHTYKVRFISGDCRGDWSQPLIARTGVLSKPSNVNYVAFANSIELRWVDVAEAESYEIEINSRLDKTFVTVTESDYKHLGLFSNTSYSYRIKAINSGGTSEWSDVINCTTVELDAPINIDMDITNNKITISWDPVLGASQYDVYVDGEIKTTGQETKFIHSDLEPNTTHIYKVRGVNNFGSGKWSYASNITTLLLNSPANVRSTGMENKIALSWDKVENATSYEIELDGVTTYTTPYNDYVFSGLTSDETHTFRIRAKNTNGMSAWSIPLSQIVANAEDGLKGQWIQNETMNFTMSYAGAAKFNDKIYVIGGYNASRISAVNEEYDPKTNSWEIKASMTTARYGLGVVNVNGKIYAIGGNDSTNYLCTVEEYDPSTDTWTTKTPMPTARAYFGITALNGKIYAIGGYNRLGYLNTVEEYDPITDQWSTKASMPTQRKGLALGVINNTIYAIDGYNGTVLGIVEEYYPDTNNWVKKGDLSVDRELAVVAVSNNRIFIIGGRNDTTIFGNVEEYNPETNVCLKLSSLPTATYSSSFEVMDSYIYVIGGISSNNIQKFILSVPSNIPTAPDNIFTSLSGNAVSITWDTVAGATSYDIEIDGNLVYTTNTNSCIHSSITLGSEHTFSIRSKNVAGAGEWSNKITIFYPDVTYSSDVVPAMSSNNQPIPYTVQGSSANGNEYKAFDNTTGYWSTGETAPMGGHYLRVDLGDANQKRITKIRLATFKNGTNCSIKNWELWASNDDINYTKLTQGIQPNSTSTFDYIFENTYSYRFYRLNVINSYYDISGASVGVSELELMSPQELEIGLNTPINFTATSNNKNSMTLSWATVSGATGYDIDWNGILISVSGTSYTHSNLLPGTLHKYRIRSKTSIQVSNWSDVVEKYTLLDSPTRIKAESSGTSIILIWGPVPDAVGYDIQADNKVYDNGMSTNFIHSGLTCNSQHIYKIRVRTKNNQSDFSTALTYYTTPDTPTSITTTKITGTSVSISWTTVTGTTSYDIRVNGVIVKNVTTTSYTHTELVPNREYTIQVRARNSGGAGGWSKEYRFQTLKNRGTEQDPYLIYTREDLYAINSNLSAYFKLMSDIDLQNIEWIPLASLGSPFTGQLDGNGYTIKNLTINQPSTRDVGFFVSIGTNAFLKNVKIDLGEKGITGMYHVGGLVGVAKKGSTILDCSVEGSGTINVNTIVEGPIIINGNTAIGGLVGIFNGTLVSKSSSSVNVIAKGTGVAGGLIGTTAYGAYNIGDDNVRPTISECYSTGNVTNINGAAGGLIGESVDAFYKYTNIVKISKCYSSGYISASTAYGLAGLCRTDIDYSDVYGELYIDNCFSTSTLEGANVYPISASYRTGNNIGTYSILNSYFAGKMISANRYGIGIKSNYIDAKKADITISDGTNKITTEMKYAATYKDWNFENIWMIEEGGSYPYLKMLPKPESVKIQNDNDFAGGRGMAEDPFLISTENQLYNIRYSPNGHFKLINNIKLTCDWIPVGSKNNSFTGVFDGNGYVINNFTIHQPDNDYIGFFSSLGSGALIKNITLHIGDNGVNGNTMVGSLVGYAQKGSQILNCSAIGDGVVSGKDFIGGLVGCFNGDMVTNSISTVDVSAIDSSTLPGVAGGLIGSTICQERINTNSRISNCASTGNVTNLDGVAGGLVGRSVYVSSYSSNKVNISECFATGHIKGITVYGLVGLYEIYITSSNYEGDLIIKNSYSHCILEGTSAHPISSVYIGSNSGESSLCHIENCYFAGQINATNVYGFLIRGSSSSPVVSLINNYFDYSINPNLSDTNIKNITKKTTAEMMQQSTFTNWDFTNIWAIQEGKSYPFLKNLVNSLGISISNISSNSVSIIWNPVEGANSYELEVDGVISNELLTEPNFIHQGLQPNTVHTYRFRTYKQGIVSDWSPLLTVTTLAVQIAVPKNVSAVNINNQIKISWDTVPEAKEYEIEIDGQIISVGSSLEYIDNNYANISQHIYRVRARNPVAISEWSDIVSQINWKENTPAICLYESNWLEPDNTGDEVEIIVKANNITDMYTVQMTLKYNPSQLILNKDSISQLLWNDDTTGYFQYAVDETKGQIKILVSAKADEDSKSGLVDILSLKFRLNGIDNSSIKVINADIVDSAGIYIKGSDVADLNIHVIE